MMKTVGAALILTILGTGIQLLDSKHASTFHYNTHGSKLVVYPSSWRCEIDSLEDQGWILDTCEESAIDDHEFYVFHGHTCKVVKQDPVSRMSLLQTIKCQRGKWISETDHLHNRKKRFDWELALGGVALGYEIGCSAGWWCDDPEPVYIPLKPPTYSNNCPPSDLQSVYNTPAGQEAVTVTWSDPVATDSDGSINSNQRVSGTQKGGSFSGSTEPGGRQHTILYQATDNDGQTAYCYFTFAVQVRTCDALLWPQNGYRNCDHDNILGSTCKVSCNDGYNPVNGISETTCSGEDNPQWSSEPSCEKRSCATPRNVTNGDVICSSGHMYGDYCTMSCHDDYTLEGQVFTRCEADGEWFWGVPTTCTDGVAPELKCYTPQIFYADWASPSTAVHWELPLATDNIDSAPVVTKTGGSDQGVVIEAGSSAFVTYEALDAAGNQSPSCTIELRVEATSCGHPLDTLVDSRLRFNCTTDPKYIYGDTCTLSCGLNLPLEGTDLITCERTTIAVGPPIGYWDWGNGSMPYCRDISCPSMLPPRNGALVFDWISGRPTNTMLCKREYSLEVPELSSFNGIFICQDSGTWNPYYEKAPDCSVQYSSRGYKLPSDFFYYEGVCGVNDTILANFEKIVANLDTIYAALCPVGTVCETQNPQITCGEYRRKRSEKRNFSISRPITDKVVTLDTGYIPHILKKRQAVTILAFSFDITIIFDTSQMNNSEQWDYADYVQLEVLKPAIQAAVMNGTFDRTGWAPLDNFETAEYGDPVCDPGSVVVQLTKCSKCPAGHLVSDNECVKCPIGEYCETGGCPLCTACPDGYSTRGEGSESVDNCTQLCTPGTYSPDTFVPCAQCKAGTYQPQTGQTQCLPCPMGKSTESAGSRSESDCQVFDAIVTDTGGNALTVDIPSLSNLGLEFFVKTVSGTPDIAISVNGELDIAITETITITTGSTSDELGASSDDAWVQVSINWNVTNGEFTAFYRGDNIARYSSIFPATIPLVQNGQFNIMASGSAAAISGLRLRDTLIEETDILSATTCHNIDATDVVNMEHIKHLEGITLLLPAVCDVVDECLSSPCGEHSSKCTNNVDGFTCTCKGGWIGDTCETPPDYCLGNDCQNGATCISELTDYTCQCQPGYSGVDCEKPPVNGGWSLWSRWTECSATCNAGSRERTRSCDSPAPDVHGHDCMGDDIEMEDCNTSPCLVCPDIERGKGALPKCEVDPSTGTQVCIAICIDDGHVRPPGLGNDTYTCGMETDYKWQPKKKIPGCTIPSSPRRMEVSTTASFAQTVPPTAEQSVINGITSKVDSTACHNSDQCTVDIQMGTGGKRRRRNTGTQVTITFSIALTDTSDLQLDQFIQNGTISPALQEIIDAINNLEATAVAINDSASIYFDVTTDGVTYTVDTDTVTFEGAAICNEGQVVTNGVCAECPAGSYQFGDYCSLCAKGTYQDQTGQAECVQCPSGFTTETVGSDINTDCSVPDTATNSPTTPLHSIAQSVTPTQSVTTTQSTNWQHHDEKSDDGALIIVVIVVSVLVVVVTGVIVAIVCIMKHNNARSKITDSRADLRGLTNPVYSMPPAATFAVKQGHLPPRPSSVCTVQDLNFSLYPDKDNCSVASADLYA